MLSFSKFIDPIKEGFNARRIRKHERKLFIQKLLSEVLTTDCANFKVEQRSNLDRKITISLSADSAIILTDRTLVAACTTPCVVRSVSGTYRTTIGTTQLTSLEADTIISNIKKLLPDCSN